MSTPQSHPMQLHTADYYQKTKALRSRHTWSRGTWASLFGTAIVAYVVMVVVG